MDDRISYICEQIACKDRKILAEERKTDRIGFGTWTSCMASGPSQQEMEFCMDQGEAPETPFLHDWDWVWSMLQKK